MQNLFVYGSLLFPEIIKGLTGKSFKTQDVVLSGYKRCMVIDADYPALIKHEKSEVSGKLIFDVDNRSLEIITFFEGDDYACKRIEIDKKGKTIDAYLFIWKMGLDYLVKTDWNEEKFRDDSLPFYTERVIPETVKEFNKNKNELF